MMELQTLQEALKVEIQVHQKLVAQMKQDPQNADLKKQLHELQAKITALSEKQKKVVEQLRKDLLVKQEPEPKVVQLQPSAADKKHVLQIPSAQTLQAPPTQVLQAPPTQTLPAPPTQTLQALPPQTLQAPPTQTLQAPPPQTLGLQQKTLTVTPVITTKTLPLVLKAAAMPTSLLPQRPTVAMVTAISAAPKPADSQNAPINLQVASKLTNQGSEPVRLVSRNAVVVQATTTTSTQAIKVPQFVPPPRLTPRPTFQPQVRPKPSAPNNVPIAPAPAPPMMVAPQLVQRPVMLTTKLSSAPLSSAAGPTKLSSSAAGPVHQLRIVNGQPCAAAAKSQPSGPVAGIVITTPAGSARLATPTQTLQISGLVSDAKVRTMTVKAQGGSEQKLLVSTTSSSTRPLSPAPRPRREENPQLHPAPRPKREENPQKLAFMVSLGLVTHDHLEEIQSRRQERKRRTTANPVYSGAMFEPERKKSAVTYLNTPLHQGTRKRGRPPKYSSVPELGSHTPTSPSSCITGSPAPERPDTGGFPLPVHPHPLLPLPSPSSGDGDIHEDFCTVCRRSGQLLMCDTCSRVYHLDCLEPPLKTIPKGMWICPKCQDQILKKEEAIPWPGTLAIVHSYIAYKEAKEEEKQKLVKWSAELKLEREHLEQRVKQLSNSITKCMETKNTILARQKEMHGSLEKVKNLVRLIQAFNFTQALEKENTNAITEDNDRVQEKTVPAGQQTVDGAASEAVAEAVSESVNEAEAEAGVTPQNSSSCEAREKDEAEVQVDAEMEAAGVSAEAAVDVGADESTVSAVIGAAAALGVSIAQSEAEAGGAEEVTEAEPEDAAVAVPEDSAVATTNGHTSDLACSDASSKEESFTNTTNTASEDSVSVTIATTNSTEEVAAEEVQDENTNNDCSTNNSKTSEPSQHSLPAILNSVDNKE